MVVLDDLNFIGEAAGDGQLHLVLRLVRPVPALLLRLPEHRGRQAPLTGQLRHVIRDAVFVKELRLLELPRLRLVAEAEGDARVHHRLALHHVREVVRRDGNVREHVQVRQPAGAGAGLSALALGQGRFVQLAHDLAPLKVERILLTVPPDGDIHVPGGVLGGAGAQAVESQRILVIVAGDVVVLAAGVQLAVHQLPVVPLLLLVPVHRAAPAGVLHLNGTVQKPGNGDGLAMALPGLVDGVGEDLKYRVLAAVQPVGAENDAGPLSDTVRALQGRNALVAVILLSCRHSSSKKADSAPKSIYGIVPQPPHRFKCSRGKRPFPAVSLHPPRFFEEMLLRNVSHNRNVTFTNRS